MNSGITAERMRSRGRSFVQGFLGLGAWPLAKSAETLSAAALRADRGASSPSNQRVQHPDRASGSEVTRPLWDETARPALPDTPAARHSAAPRQGNSRNVENPLVVNVAESAANNHSLAVEDGY